MAAAMQLQLPPYQSEKNRARNDPIQRLAGTIDIGGPREDGREAIGLHIGHEAEVAGSA